MATRQDMTLGPPAVARVVGLPPIQFHDQRGTAVQVCFATGAPIPGGLKGLLGHADLGMTLENHGRAREEAVVRLATGLAERLG